MENFCYLPPSDSIEEFERSLDAIVASARTCTLPVAIGGDFNAWTTEWGSKKMNHRGRSLLKAFAMLELKIGNMATYTKEEYSSIVDLTFVNPILSRGGSYWQVSDQYTGSDHWALTYQLHPTSRTANMTRIPKRNGPQLLSTGKLFSASWKEHLSKEQLRLGLKASHGSSQRHAMLRCTQSRIIADALQWSGGTSTLR